MKLEINTFFNNVDDYYKNNVESLDGIEDTGINNLKEAIEFYEDIQRIMVKRIPELMENKDNLSQAEISEYTKKATEVFNKCDRYISKINEVLEIKNSLITKKIIENRKNPSLKLQSEIYILKYGGRYNGFRKEYNDLKAVKLNPNNKTVIKKSKDDEIDEIIKYVKEEIYKEAIPIENNEVQRNINPPKKEEVKENKTKVYEKPTLKEEPKANVYRKPVPKEEPIKVQNNSVIPQESKKEETKINNAINEFPSINNGSNDNKKEEVKNVSSESKEFEFPATLSELIVQGYLPNNIDEKKLIETCNNLGIKAKDLNFKIDKDLYSRLDNDKVIKDARFNLEVVNKHKQKIKEYDKLINEYENMYKEVINSGSFDSKYIRELRSTIQVLMQEKAKYTRNVDNMKFDDVSSYYQFNIGFDNKAISINKKHEKVNNELREQYQILDKQKIELKNATSNKMKQIINRRIEKTEKTIRSLKAKESLYNSKQVKIINDNSQKYINIVKYKQERYAYEKKNARENVRQVIDYNNEKKRLNEEKQNIYKDLANVNDSNIKGLVERIKLEKEVSDIEKAINRLQKKEGRCIKQAQFYHRETKNTSLK